MLTKRIHCLGVLVLDALSGPLESYPVPRKRVQSVTKTIRFAAGDFLCRELQRMGVDIRGIRVSPADTTPFTFVGIHTDGDRTFIHTPGANLTFNPEDLDREQLLATDYLLYQDLWVLPKLVGMPGSSPAWRMARTW